MEVSLFSGLPDSLWTSEVIASLLDPRIRSKSAPSETLPKPLIRRLTGKNVFNSLLSVN
jgi:hypothetical protein